jgi:hypothetical protein
VRSGSNRRLRVAQHDKGLGLFAAQRVGHGHHRRQQHGGVLLEDGLHFGRGDVFAAAADHVLLASDDAHRRLCASIVARSPVWYQPCAKALSAGLWALRK